MQLRRGSVRLFIAAATLVVFVLMAPPAALWANPDFGYKPMRPGGWTSFALASASTERGGPLQFPDASLEIVIRNKIDRPDGPIYPADVESIVELHAAFTNIQSIEGIEHLSALQTLDLAYNYISDITPLAGLRALTTLDLANNDVHDIRPLADLTLLETLDVSSNRVASLAGVEHLGALQTLDISSNPVGVLRPLEGLPRLETLSAVAGRIVDLHPLATIKTLQNLQLDDNEIVDVTPLGALPNLSNLSLFRNSIEDVTPLASLPKLQTLNVDDNEIEDIAPLAALDGLQELSARRNRIADIGPLVRLPDLHWLNVSGNLIRKVDSSFLNAEGVTVHLFGNPIDRSHLSGDTVERMFGTLRDEYTKGPYTIGFYESDTAFDHAEVRRGDDVLWYVRSRSLTLPDEQYFSVLELGAEDVTGDGHEDLLIVEYTGGAHCCTFVHVLKLEPDFRHVDTVAGLHSNPHFSDLDGDGTVEVKVRDWTFAYWYTPFSSSPAPEVVLRFDGERFRVAAEHMRTEAPDAATFAALALEVRADGMWEMYKKFRGALAGPPPQLWAVMLDLIYTGHWDLAFQFLNLAWPDDVRGKDVFARAFLKQLQSSPYWDDIREELSGVSSAGSR